MKYALILKDSKKQVSVKEVVSAFAEMPTKRRKLPEKLPEKSSPL
jgi:hypothetical protein